MQEQAARKKTYYAGVDSGTITTKVAILDDEGNIAGTAVLPTGAKSQDSAIKTFGKALMAVGITREPIKYIVATGYGRHALKWTDRDVTEINCDARGARYFFPDARTVIDIGGQDSKVIQIDEKGDVVDFTMNDKCAAGTGMFLELAAAALGTDVKALSKMGLNWKENLVITSRCAVFAQAEAAELLAGKKDMPDIVHALNNSVASRVYTQIARQDAQPEYVMMGGVAYNAGVVAELEGKLETKLRIPAQPEICGALGAAIIAMEGL